MSTRGVYASLRGDLDLLLESYDADVAHMSRHGFYIELAQPVARKWFAEPRVKQALVRYGFVPYWREAGWPALCRPSRSGEARRFSNHDHRHKAGGAGERSADRLSARRQCSYFVLDR